MTPLMSVPTDPSTIITAIVFDFSSNFTGLPSPEAATPPIQIMTSVIGWFSRHDQLANIGSLSIIDAS